MFFDTKIYILQLWLITKVEYKGFHKNKKIIDIIPIHILDQT